MHTFIQLLLSLNQQKEIQKKLNKWENQVKNRLHTCRAQLMHFTWLWKIMIYGNKMGLGNRFVRFCCVIEIGAKANGINISKYLPKSALNWTDSSVTHIPADVYFTVTHSICTLKFNCTIAILMLLLFFFDKKFAYLIFQQLHLFGKIKIMCAIEIELRFLHYFEMRSYLKCSIFRRPHFECVCVLCVCIFGLFSNEK